MTSSAAALPGSPTGADHPNIGEKTDMTEKPSTVMKRMWFNQPSKLQPLHRLHGVNVLACPDTDRTMRAYFLSGDIIDMQAPRETLSEGWR